LIGVIGYYSSPFFFKIQGIFLFLAGYRLDYYEGQLDGQGFRQGNPTRLGNHAAGNPDKRNDPFGISYLKDKKNLVLNWFEMRLILEPASVRLVAERASDEEIKEIVRYERETAQLIKEGKPYLEADKKFHSAIAKATHNKVIELMLPAIEAAVRDAIITAAYVGTDKLSAENALVNHRLIAGFLEKRDADGAALAMYCHIKRGITDLES
jgi:DNA-binding FadR family transcriptional regulator